MYIKDAQKIACEQTGEFLHASLEEAKAWLEEAQKKGLQPTESLAGNEIWYTYHLDGGRRVILAEAVV